MQGFKEKFQNYLNTAQQMLIKKKKENTNTRGLHLLINEPMELNTLVSQLEEQEEFIKLLDEIKTIFDARKDSILFLVQVSAFPFTENRLNPFRWKDSNYSDDLWWKTAIHNYLCRSGFYRDIYNGSNVDFDKFLSHFYDAFQEEQFKIRYFLPLGNVSFSEPLMSFKKFSIRELDHGDLDTILQNETNLVFYKYAFFDTTDAEGTPYLCFEDIRNASEERDKAIGGEGEDEYHFNDYGLYPKEAKFILRCLSLYPWEEKELSTRSEPGKTSKAFLIDKEEFLFSNYKLSLPFVIEVQETLYCFPPEPPSSYARGLADLTLIDFNNIETEQFKNFINRYIRLIERVSKTEELKFIDNAINFLFKAFFSKGMESLLWNIVAIESLIGKRGEPAEGITKTLAERIAKLLGDKEDEREKLQKRFEKLYEFRSRLVHGSNDNEEIKEYYYFLGRSLARSMVQRFLDEIHTGKIGRPNRRNIISSMVS